jgi:hypothetical protein
MKTLIIHHLEMTWEDGYKRAGTSFYELSEKVISHIKRAKYDRIILTQFENWKAQDEHYESGIADFITDWKDYGYGWVEEEGMFDDGFIKDDYGNEYVKGGNHSEIVLLADWMRLLKNDKVSICGAFDGECVEDLEIALRACAVKFRRVEKLIV